MAQEKTEGAPRGLIKKLCEVMAATGWVQKGGTNEKQNYHYATESDVLVMLRKELAARHVFVFPSVENVSRTAHGKTSGGYDMFITDIMVKWTFLDGETGETQECMMPGCGTDTGDKGLYKAITGSSKYLFLKAFMLPTGDDPENESPDGRPKDSKVAPRASTAKVAPKAAGNENVVLEPFGEGLVSIMGNGLSIVKSEMTKADRDFFGIKVNPKGAPYMQAKLADKFADLCRRCKVGCVNMDSAPKRNPNLPKANIPPFEPIEDVNTSECDDPILTEAKVVEREGKKTFMTVKWDGNSHTTFDKGLFPLLTAAKGQPVWLEVKANGKYSNIVGLVRVNGMNLADDQNQGPEESSLYE